MNTTRDIVRRFKVSISDPRDPNASQTSYLSTRVKQPRYAYTLQVLIARRGCVTDPPPALRNMNLSMYPYEGARWDFRFSLCRACTISASRCRSVVTSFDRIVCLFVMVRSTRLNTMFAADCKILRGVCN